MKQNYFSRYNADAKALFQKGVPILNYHMVEALPRDKKLKGLYIPPASFRRQLTELKQAGFSSVPPEVVFNPEKEFHRKFVITFDDAFQSVFDHALDSLLDLEFRAIQFVVPDYLGKSNQWDLILGEKQLPIMNASTLKEWISAGQWIGSHTRTHPYLTRIPAGRAREEIFSSKKILEDQFGVPIHHFCYPYGDFNPEIRDLVEEAGYRTACTVRFGVNDGGTDPYQLARIKGRHPTRKLKSMFPWFKTS